ncbi:helix-turn-helix domain-containing protein [Roseateles saccharophilus]|uniref:Helix-turn-helix protein n=1 Tax=Roseateles saccharophilus TaxID=304 RepID=A0A4R3U7A9_ROSSA|nr:helix-turn-helix transcriptional regulator [Roseateles saccharophilus]MDG0835812.1 XRE family transcriptional regulator [Roseateles saccharophilus]TCU83631.1 helix-turn-helix protein [Roseateles saccharophilus]
MEFDIFRSMGDFESTVKAMGAKLKEMRKARGLRQIDVADRAGIPRLQVVHVEAGRPGVAVSAYARVAAALGAQFQLVPAQRPTLEEIGALLDGERG